MTLGELLEGKELPVRVKHLFYRVNTGGLFEVRYILGDKAFGHTIFPNGKPTSHHTELSSTHYEIYTEPPTVTLKKYQIVYKSFSGSFNAAERWFENEEEAKKFFIDYAPTTFTIKYLEGHDIEVEVDNE